MEKLPAQDGGFQTPGQMNTSSQSRTPSDASGHWASSWINEVIQYGILELGPDGRFYPMKRLLVLNMRCLFSVY